MTRETSIEAYYKLINGGSISKKRWQIFDTLVRYSPKEGLTANETWEVFTLRNNTTLRHDSNTRARFTELREMGLIKENSTKPCSITGANCIAWIPTWSTHVKKIKKGITKDQQIKALKLKIEKFENNCCSNCEGLIND